MMISRILISNDRIAPLASTLLAALLCSSCGALRDPPRPTYIPQPNDARVVLTAQQPGQRADFAISHTENGCEAFEAVGAVRKSLRGVLLDWVADTTEFLSGKLPEQLEISVPAARVLQVKSRSLLLDEKCGPVSAKFIPRASAKYSVEAAWMGRSCGIRVTEITEVGAVPVPGAVSGTCSPSFWDLR